MSEHERRNPCDGRARVRVRCAFLEHKGCFNEQAGTELAVTPAFSSSALMELPGESPGCHLYGERSVVWGGSDFHGEAV